MQAIVKAEPKVGAQLCQVAVPEITAREVLARVRVASICGTDLCIYRWDRWSARRIHPPWRLATNSAGWWKMSAQRHNRRRGTFGLRGDAPGVRLVLPVPHGAKAHLPERPHHSH